MAWVVYTRVRARAPHALYIDRGHHHHHIPLYTYITHYTYWALGGSFSCARVIHKGLDKTPENREPNFVSLSPELRGLFTIPSQNLLPLT